LVHLDLSQLRVLSIWMPRSFGTLSARIVRYCAGLQSCARLEVLHWGWHAEVKLPICPASLRHLSVRIADEIPQDLQHRWDSVMNLESLHITWCYPRLDVATLLRFKQLQLLTIRCNSVGCPDLFDLISGLPRLHTLCVMHANDRVSTSLADRICLEHVPHVCKALNSHCSIRRFRLASWIQHIDCTTEARLLPVNKTVMLDADVEVFEARQCSVGVLDMLPT
jgi:hypothetical protein